MKPSRFFPLLLPPLLTASLLLALYAFGGLFPFGTKTLVWCDMKQQVVPLMMQLKELLTGNGSLLYSPLSAGGMNFWGVFFFFLASPFSFLCLLTPREDFLFLMNLLVLLKLSLSALTAAVYFRKRYPGLGSLGIPLSVMYALCGYGMLFYQNLIWLDMMALFPLLLLSCRTLAKEGRVLPYTLALTAAMVLNYYIGYMVVLFLILCFGIALLLSPKERRGRLAAGFLLGSALAALLSAVVWLPSLLQYASSGRGRDIIAGLKGSRLLAYLHTTLSLLLGTAFVLPALFLLRKRGAGRELALQGVLLALLTLPLILEPVNKMWHTGSYMSFPARYGFMTVFLALSLTGGLLELTEEARKEGHSHPAALLLGGVCGCGLLVFGIRYYASNTETLSRYVRTLWGSNASFWGLMIFFGLALVLYELLLILREKQLLGRRGLCLLLTLTALAEGSFSGQVYMLSARDKTDTVLWQQAADLGGRVKDDGFYRVKAEKKDFDVNLLGGMGYPTFAHYTSLTSETTLSALKKLGYSAYWMEVGSHGGTALTDALLSVKYQISRTEAPDAVYRNDRYSISLLPDALPLGLLTDDPGWEELPEGQRIEIQQALFEQLLGHEEQLFTAYEPEILSCSCEQKNGRYYLRTEGEETAFLTWVIPVEGQQILYFDCFDRVSTALKEAVNDSFQIAVNGVVLADSYPSQSRNGLLELGSYEDETVTVTAILKKDLSCASFGVWGLNRQLLQDALQQAETAGLQPDNRSPLSLYAGSFDNASGASWCFLSLPWDEGYRVTVNGSRVEPVRCLDGFMAVPIGEGENTITISYFPRGLAAGLVLTAAGILLLILLRRKRSGLCFPKAVEALSKTAVLLLLGAVLVCVYLGPVILCLMGK